jgi:4-hydroxy-3-polyprenylbenzoate decarboxylase
VGKFLTEFRKRKEKLPLTLNIGCPPAVMTVAASGSLHQAIPAGSDELAIAGGLQGFPVEICKAKTVDTYAIANAEWVIEGYLDPLQLVWESEEAEKTSDWQQPFLIEWRGYQGLARRAPKFKVTAVTHRKNNPIFYATVASGLECFTTSGSFVEAVIYDTCNHILPGLVENVSVLDSMHGNAGVVIQVKKKRREDDEFIKTLIMAAFTASVVLQLIIVVDEDINIYSAEDIIWVLMTRVKPKEDIIAFGMDEGVMPEVSGKSAAASLARLGRLGKLGFDATVSFEGKPLWSRKQHPKVELEKWFTGEEIARVRAQQNEYARFISEYRF